MRAHLGAWSLALGLTLGVIACAPGDVSGLRERAQQAWSEVLSEYHQRADQVPPLVEVVGKKAPGEREVLGEVMAAHDEVVAIRNADGFLAEPERFRHYEQAQQRLSNALETLYATIKRYPELTGDTAVQNQLRGFQHQEDQLVVARSDLISAVRAHNEELHRFPDGWLVALFSPQAKPLTAFAQAEIEQPPTPAKP
ncbi:MAG: LemA family protein [Gemmatimonadales bacterium]